VKKDLKYDEVEMEERIEKVKTKIENLI